MRNKIMAGISEGFRDSVIYIIEDHDSIDASQSERYLKI